ncbi:MAG: HRDC domain-containing protein, partial [Myxococcales bacterium]|nr:HRDC domain-containing protein [Myxococcales bacterium]
AIFNNEQLAAMVTGGVSSTKDLAAIPGVGPARMERYAAAFLDRLAAARQAPVAEEA